MSFRSLGHHLLSPWANGPASVFLGYNSSVVGRLPPCWCRSPRRSPQLIPSPCPRVSIVWFTPEFQTSLKVQTYSKRKLCLSFEVSVKSSEAGWTQNTNDVEASSCLPAGEQSQTFCVQLDWLNAHQTLGKAHFAHFAILQEVCTEQSLLHIAKYLISAFSSASTLHISNFFAQST